MLSTFAATRSHSLAQQFAVSPANRLWRELRGMGMTPAPLPAARASRPFSVLAARRAFARLLSDAGVDAAMFHGSWTHAIFATVARERGRRRRVLAARADHRAALARSLGARGCRRRRDRQQPVHGGGARVPRRADARHLLPGGRICRISAEERKAGRAALGAGDDDVVVLMAARLEAWKGHTGLDRGRSSCCGDARLKVWIAGGVQQDGERPYFDAARAADRTRPVWRSSVSLLGERTDVPEPDGLADIYCQPNLAPEPFGIAIAEAMRSGLPCVVSNTGGAAELVDAESAASSRRPAIPSTSPWPSRSSPPIPSCAAGWGARRPLACLAADRPGRHDSRKWRRRCRCKPLRSGDAGTSDSRPVCAHDVWCARRRRDEPVDAAWRPPRDRARLANDGGRACRGPAARTLPQPPGSAP